MVESALGQEQNKTQTADHTRAGSKSELVPKLEIKSMENTQPSALLSRNPTDE